MDQEWDGLGLPSLRSGWKRQCQATRGHGRGSEVTQTLRLRVTAIKSSRVPLAIDSDLFCVDHAL